MTILTESRTATRTETTSLTVAGLGPAPHEVWEQMLRFSGPTADEIRAMRQTVEVLFRHGHDLVVGTYDYLRQVPETAEILGWERGFDEQHLSERRQFFTIWLARTLSIDLGHDFARYLFRAGQIHAGHGPRHIHVPPQWVTGSIGLVLGAFAGYIREAHTDVEGIAPALVGWNKYLLAQLNQMNEGYQVARALDDGEFKLPVKVYGQARQAWGRDAIEVGYRGGERVADVLRKLVAYAPILRDMLFEEQWYARDDEKDLWLRLEKRYILRGNWRVLLNGHDLRYYGGFERALEAGDDLSLFPPGR